MKTDGSDQSTKGNGVGRELTPKQTLYEEIQKLAGQFEKALAGKITLDRMVRIILTAVQTTPKLAECSRVSFFGAVMQSCQLALEPNTPLGQAYLIPRWNGSKKCLECNFQLGYQGILDLAYRSGQYKRITAEVVYEGDDFNYEYGLDYCLSHKPAGKTEKPLYVYAIYELKNGGTEFKVWSWDRVMQHAEQFSESFDKSYSPWKSNKESQESMAKKTVLIYLLKYAPKSAEIASAVNTDERVLSARQVEDGSHSFVSIDIEDITPPPSDTNPKETTLPTANGTAVQAGDEKQVAEGKTLEKETAPAGKMETAKQGQQSKTASQTANTTATGNDKDGRLFGDEEAKALEEQYEREQAGVEPPDFD